MSFWNFKFRTLVFILFFFFIVTITFFYLFGFCLDFVSCSSNCTLSLPCASFCIDSHSHRPSLFFFSLSRRLYLLFKLYPLRCFARQFLIRVFVQILSMLISVRRFFDLGPELNNWLSICVLSYLLIGLWPHTAYMPHCKTDWT